MRTLLVLSLFCLVSTLSAKQNAGVFTENEKQSISLLIAANHYKKPRVNRRYLRTPATLKSYLKKLDPYSKYFSATEVAFKKKRSQEKRLGLGLDLLVDKNKILAVPINGGPAYQAGFKTPAYIHSINNKKISATNFNSFKFLINFSVGQSIKVKTASKRGEPLKTYTIQARFFSQKHVFIERFKNFSLLNIRQFTSNNTLRIKQALISLPSTMPLVIDLRFNPGGDLYETVDTLSFFLRKNVAVAYLNKKGNRNPIALKTLSGKITANNKIILLVSHFTASSAEIFAQAIKFYLPRTKIIGLPTAGKCLAQEIHLLKNSSALQLSVYEVLNAKKSHCQFKPMPVVLRIKNAETATIPQLMLYLNKVL